MARLFALFVAAVGAAMLFGTPGGIPHAHAQVAEIVVTSAADATDPAVECPHATNCTLRKAIETANAEPGETELRIVFDAEVFPPAQPAAIAVAATPLPPVTRNAVTIDGAGGVVLDGTALGGEMNGLTLLGSAAGLRGVAISGFGGACLVVGGPGATIGGDRTAGGGNQLGNCETGASLNAERALLRGNHVGVVSGSVAPLTTGIAVEANGTTVGGLDLAPALANIIGNASDGIVVGAVADTLIAGNNFGATGETSPAPLDRAITVRPAALRTRISENVLGAATDAAVSLPAAESGTDSASTTVRDNQFRALGGLEIDIGADGIRNSNDNGDGDGGPNGRLNHPVITRPTQATIDGIACAGCTVELYRAQHSPGRLTDFAADLVATTVAQPSGAFSFVSPPVVPGEWVAASATDAAGNTSEFSLSTRVGVGAIQCGNVELLAGWNQTGYFGTSTILLGERFPGDPAGLIEAVYELKEDGSYARWFRDTAVGRTLTSLVPGRAYWFLLDGPLVLQDGFSLTAPLGVTLRAGLNAFVYFGATANVFDAFSSLSGAAPKVWEWVADAEGGSWQSWGSQATPDWAREFGVVKACGTYMVSVDSNVLLEPLHP